MPASKRKVSGGPTAAAKAKSKSQSTLAFHGKSNKVTKPGQTPTGKAAKKDLSLLDSPTGPIDLTATSEPDVKEPTTAELSLIEQTEAEAQAPVDPEDDEASRVTEARIKKYWREKESLRKAPRVHQEDLSLHEKVCREFDTDGRFGPCVGIARIKRWKRASMLGLKPPIEVLAILLQEQEDGNVKAQQAHVDELLNSRFVES